MKSGRIKLPGGATLLGTLPWDACTHSVDVADFIIPGTRKPDVESVIEILLNKLAAQIKRTKIQQTGYGNSD